MPQSDRPIFFAGSTLRANRHVCAFFSSAREEYETLLPFVRDGFERGERAYHVCHSHDRDEHLEQLRNAGVDVTEGQRSRQLEVVTAEETYLRGGHFDTDEMLTLIQETLKTGAGLGFPLTRMIAHAESVLEDQHRVNDWIEYEARLNEILPRYGDPVICAYDSNLLSPTIAVDILRVHPAAIIGGVLRENPFFVRPAEFLREKRGQEVALPEAFFVTPERFLQELRQRRAAPKARNDQ
jgi:hypothetical protein